MNKYFIQTRNEMQNKNSISESVVPQKWESKDEFDSFTKAEQRCRQLIENTSIKARNIRICQVVGEFESTVSVKTKEQG
ncbi:hypothetical protein ACFQ4Z_02735 [Oceanobacillus oncorhynchi subsp. oncorhynchi]|uniref:hypothetical protein n=1 Tax=Oceanobacillus oncorhynchi TaxID=545501 RepID=UPI00362C6AFA